MNVLYPRLPRAIAVQLFAALGDGVPEPALRHPSEVFAPVGGSRAQHLELLAITTAIEQIAREHGYPRPIGPSDRLRFDRFVARELPRVMPMTWSEAAAPDVWSFCALVLLPHLTVWRFGSRNIERWVASDLTRHTWARYWWRGVVFANAWDAFEQLTESDLNQLLERRGLGGDITLVSTLARHVIAADTNLPRRVLIRDVTRRLLRRLAFIDARALDEQGLLDLCRRTLAESVDSLSIETPADLNESDGDEDE